MRLTNKLEEHINTLTEAINEVLNMIESETYGMDPSDALVTPLLLPLVKIEVQPRAMETGIQEYDDVIHQFGTLSIDFSKLALVGVYTIQHVATTEIRIRENTLSYQDTN